MVGKQECRGMDAGAEAGAWRGYDVPFCKGASGSGADCKWDSVCN